MEIITPGKPESERAYEGQCNYCKCRVRFKREEAKSNTSPKNEQSLYVPCPTPKCNSKIYVEI